jgi:ABC-type transporter Mla maintaining outer membrane lipid asymmetry ATPase subunit MlaF
MDGVTVVSMTNQATIVAEDVNWSVAVGDYWVVAGLQGSGKSDFLMLTGGLMAPAHGQYRLFGETMPIFEDSRLPHRLRLGFVFDGGQLFGRLSIRENIALPLQYHHELNQPERDQAVNLLLQMTELAPWSEHPPGAVPRVWQKRAGLARALALKPEVLLLDNPLGGLDLRHKGWWLDFLDRLSQGHPFLAGRPLTLIATAADLHPWQGHARQFALLNARRFQLVGSWGQLQSVSEEPLRELLTGRTQTG